MNKMSFKYLKIVYREYSKRIKDNDLQPDFFANNNFNKSTNKLSEYEIDKSCIDLFNKQFIKLYNDDGFKLLNDGIAYYEKHCISYRLKKWFVDNVLSIVAIFISICSFLLSLISLLLDLTS